MYRAAIESICGLRVRGGRISVTPRLPSDWARVQLTLRRDGRVHELIICAAWAKRDIENATANGAVHLEESEWLALEEAGDVVAACDRDARVETGRGQQYFRPIERPPTLPRVA